VGPARLQRGLWPRLAFKPRGYEGGDLFTADRQSLASVRGMAHKKITCRGRTITFGPVRKQRQLLPVTKEIAKRGELDSHGHYCSSEPKPARMPGSLRTGIQVALDETGTPVLYTSGKHYDHCAYSRISFAGERWLMFPSGGRAGWTRS
jgi:hypothetical protein